MIMKMKRVFFLSLIFSLLMAATVFADEGHGGIPAKVPRGHWSCREVAELAAKYGALKKLPDKEVVEKKELAASLVEILDKALTKCELEGRGAIPPGDQARIEALLDALKDELAQYEGYQTRREEIERMLAKPETLYGQGIGSNYQAQSLKLSKHFKS